MIFIVMDASRDMLWRHGSNEFAGLLERLYSMLQPTLRIHPASEI